MNYALMLARLGFAPLAENDDPENRVYYSSNRQAGLNVTVNRVARTIRIGDVHDYHQWFEMSLLTRDDVFWAALTCWMRPVEHA